jgi:hypothetical protein
MAVRLGLESWLPDHVVTAFIHTTVGLTLTESRL